MWMCSIVRAGLADFPLSSFVSCCDRALSPSRFGDLFDFVAIMLRIFAPHRMAGWFSLWPLALGAGSASGTDHSPRCRPPRRDQGRAGNHATVQ